MQFLWQGAKTQIVWIKKKKLLVGQETLCIFSSNMFLFLRKRTFRFSLSPSWIARSGYFRSKIEHFRLLRVSMILQKSNQRVLFHTLILFRKMSVLLDWLLSTFKPHKKTKCSFHLQKMVVKVIFLFTMCHFFKFIKPRTLNLRRNDPWNDVKLSLGKLFLVMKELSDQRSSFKIIADRINTLWGARARFTRTRLLNFSIQFNNSLIRTWGRSEFLRNRKTTYTKMH